MRRSISPMTLIFIAILAVGAIGSIVGNPMQWLLNELLALPAIVIGISFHEYAHALVAYKLGDMTPKFQGRVTINPGAHIDPFGFAALLFLGFGWGRSVGINPYNFKNPRRDEFLVSIAGVTMNLIIAVIFTFVYRFYTLSTGNTMYTDGMGGYIAMIIFNIVYINIILMIFNLIPVPPLDGFGIVTEIFNLKTKPWYWTIYDNGFYILMFLIIFNVTDKVLYPAMMVMLSLLGNIGLF
ncbi:MAG: site-2 protease family protein [Eubacterium sp.]|nr:site-2 protease family protein [Eubacterium sp.]